eukprot:7385908-Prymnesium_polylepis.2
MTLNVSVPLPHAAGPLPHAAAGRCPCARQAAGGADDDIEVGLGAPEDPSSKSKAPKGGGKLGARRMAMVLYVVVLHLLLLGNVVSHLHHHAVV